MLLLQANYNNQTAIFIDQQEIFCPQTGAQDEVFKLLVFLTESQKSKYIQFTIIKD